MKLFYDHLVDRSKLQKLIEGAAKGEEEKKKLIETLDEMIHHTVLDVVLLHLNEKHHEEFLTMLHRTPYSEELLVYIRQKGEPLIEKKIREEVEKLTDGIIEELKGV